MKVLHLISGGDSGGAKTHVLTLLRELNTDTEANLLCLGRGPLWDAAEKELFNSRLCTGGFLRGVREVRATLDGGDYDILHCHGARADLTAALAGSRSGTKRLSTVHSDHTLDYLGRGVSGAAKEKLNGWALRRMDALICVSDAMAETYRRRGFRRVYSIHNGVDVTAPTESVPRRERSAVLGAEVSEEDILLGAAARLEPVKDLGTLLRAMALTREPRLKLAIAGTGSQEAALRSLTEELSLADRVFFLGWVEDMEKFTACLDAAALSSLSETFPYALTMAARYGLPAVSTAVGGVPELIEDGVNGFLVPAGDAAALAKALDALCCEPLRRRMGEALRAKTAERFTLGAMGARQREIYREVLNGTGSGAV